MLNNFTPIFHNLLSVHPCKCVLVSFSFQPLSFPSSNPLFLSLSLICIPLLSPSISISLTAFLSVQLFSLSLSPFLLLKNPLSVSPFICFPACLSVSVGVYLCCSVYLCLSGSLSFAVCLYPSSHCIKLSKI